MKYSRQRELIFNVVAEHKVHPSADEIYDILKKDNPNLSLATVYRNLNQLADNNEILKVQIPGQKDRFDCALHEHYHFVCNKCKSVYDVDKKSLPAPFNETIDGHSISSFDLTLNGICKNCLSGN